MSESLYPRADAPRVPGEFRVTGIVHASGPDISLTNGAWWAGSLCGVVLGSASKVAPKHGPVDCKQCLDRLLVRGAK